VQATQDAASLVQTDGEKLSAASSNHLVGEYVKHGASDTLPLKCVLDEHPEFPGVR
jgi:hypothetical protein